MKLLTSIFTVLAVAATVQGVQAMNYTNKMNAEDLMSALDQAVHRGNLERTKLLLSDLTAPGPKYTTPVSSGGYEMNVGLQTRLGLDEKLMYAHTLLAAINANDPDIVKFIIDKHPELVNSREAARGKLAMSFKDWARQLLKEGKGNERVVRILEAARA